MNRTLRYGVLAVLLLLALAWLGQWLVNRWSQVHLVDARIAANIITLSSEAAGRVTAMAVVAGDRVSRGDLLVRIESRQAELQIQETDAEIARLGAEQNHLRAQQAMVRGQLESKREAARAHLEAAEAERQAARAGLAMATSDYERVNSLRKSGIVTMQRFEEEQARFLTAQQQELRSAAGISVVRATLATIEADAAEVTVLERRIAVFDAQKAALAVRRARQLVDLENREIRAAFDGVVGATFVDAGEYVTSGTRLLMYHDPGKVWVDANVKETEFRRLRIGARAMVRVDAYPDRVFGGAVTHLGHAATSQFALLPSPNPSGNFTKITQRLPLRVSIEQDAALLRPGMMVEVAIDVAD
jgi:membrane fusion protein, multidrug efflux system